MIYILSITLRTPNYGNYGIFLIILGNAGFISSPVRRALSMGGLMRGLGVMRCWNLQSLALLPG